MSREQFIAKYNPDYQLQICCNPDTCFFGSYPTFGEMKRMYGDNIGTAWLIPQLYNVSMYCGCKDKMSTNQLKECAYVIATEFYYLKISEMMLFFHRFKSGRYGRFYGAVDPLVITTSLREFLKERMCAYDKHEQAERMKRKEEERGKAVSWEEYCMNTYGEVKPHPLNGLNDRE